jgi:hypothetical protein
VDAFADLAGGTLAAAPPALRPGGQIAAIATPKLDLDPLLDANITFHGVLIGDDGDRARGSRPCWTGGAAARCQPGAPARGSGRGAPDTRTPTFGGKIILDVTR